jgi:hypothetical protein
MSEIWRNIPDTTVEISNTGLCKRDGVMVTPSTGTHGYYHLSVGNKMELLHRLVASQFVPNPENKPCVDHINGKSKDNRVENLRWATRAENCRNRKLHAKVSDMPRGVIEERSGRYRAQITYQRQGYILGVYDTPEEASEVFEVTAELLYGDFYAPPGSRSTSLTSA